MTLAESVDAVKQGLQNAEEDFGILTGIIICGIRNISPEISLALAKLAVEYKNQGVVGFDLAGDWDLHRRTSGTGGDQAFWRGL